MQGWSNQHWQPIYYSNK